MICSNAVISRGADIKYCLVGNGQRIEAEGKAQLQKSVLGNKISCQFFCFDDSLDFFLLAILKVNFSYFDVILLNILPLSVTRK